MLCKYINPQQLACINQLIEESEEAQFFVDKLEELTALINAMPETYHCEAVENPNVYLHYFNSTMDFYIVEKDMCDEQLQAFGLVDMGYGKELGYISIKELLENNMELDLYWETKKLNEIILKK